MSSPIWSCSVWGLPCPTHHCAGGALLPHLFTLTATLQSRRYVFCGTGRQLCLNTASRMLSGTLLYGVRTFLPQHLRRGCERPSGPAANPVIIASTMDHSMSTLALGSFTTAICGLHFQAALTCFHTKCTNTAQASSPSGVERKGCRRVRVDWKGKVCISETQ